MGIYVLDHVQCPTCVSIFDRSSSCFQICLDLEPPVTALELQNVFPNSKLWIENVNVQVVKVLLIVFYALEVSSNP